MTSTPNPTYGAPSLGPIDRITPAWDDNTPAAWRAFGEPNTPKDTHMPDHSINGGYGHQPIPTPPPQPDTDEK